jgi:23S rRNA pseudouridine2604 synthase
MSRPTLKLPAKADGEKTVKSPGRRPIRGGPPKSHQASPKPEQDSPKAAAKKPYAGKARPAAAGSDKPRYEGGDRPARRPDARAESNGARPEYLPNGGKPRVRRDDGSTDRSPSRGEAARPERKVGNYTNGGKRIEARNAAHNRYAQDSVPAASHKPGGDKPSYSYPPRSSEPRDEGSNDNARPTYSYPPRNPATPRGKAPTGPGSGNFGNYNEPRRYGKERDSERPRSHGAPGAAQGRKPAARPVYPPRPVVVPSEAPATATKAARDDLPRLSKVMSEQGLCSRREADEWIENGWVRVDGVVIDTLGTRVSPRARIEIDQAASKHQAESVTILLHKPIGYVSGQAEDGYEPASVLIRPENRWEEDKHGNSLKPGHFRGLAPAGRLDIDSTGLLVLTQDGRIARRLVGDDSKVEKEYLVRVEGTLIADGLKLLNHGLSLDGIKLKPANVSWQNEEQLRFVLREGKKRQIRRMCELVGLKVVGLKRIRIGSIVLGKLPVGQWRFLRSDEKF